MAGNLNPNIFLSYSWANTNIADEIENDFKSIGVQFKRDVRDAPYRSSIKEFMHQIGKSDFVLMIISDEYLRSENCMYEVTELLNTHEFEKRILPVIIENASHIFKAISQIPYYDYWADKKKEAEGFKKKHANEVSIAYVKKCQNIQDNLPVFFQKITDLNLSSYQKLKTSNYRNLLDIIGIKGGALFKQKGEGNKTIGFKKERLRTTGGNENNNEKPLQIDPKIADTHYNLANLLKNKFSDFKGAKLHYEKAINIDPKDNDAHYNLAILLKDHFSDYEGAKIHYQQVIKNDPTDNNAHYNLANLLKKHFSDYEGAKMHYEEAIKLNPLDNEAHHNLAIILADHFLDYEGAKIHYQKAIKKNKPRKK